MEARETGNSKSEVGKIVKIANYHLDSMNWIQDQCEEMERKLKEIEQKDKDSSKK